MTRRIQREHLQRHMTYDILYITIKEEQSVGIVHSEREPYVQAFPRCFATATTSMGLSVSKIGFPERTYTGSRFVRLCCTLR